MRALLRHHKISHVAPTSAVLCKMRARISLLVQRIFKHHIRSYLVPWLSIGSKQGGWEGKDHVDGWGRRDEHQT